MMEPSSGISGHDWGQLDGEDHHGHTKSVSPGLIISYPRSIRKHGQRVNCVDIDLLRKSNNTPERL